MKRSNCPDSLFLLANHGVAVGMGVSVEAQMIVPVGWLNVSVGAKVDRPPSNVGEGIIGAQGGTWIDWPTRRSVELPMQLAF